MTGGWRDQQADSSIQMKLRFNAFENCKSITFCWCPEQVDIKGNKNAAIRNLIDFKFLMYSDKKLFHSNINLYVLKWKIIWPQLVKIKNLTATIWNLPKAETQGS